MATSRQITCINKTVRINPHERIRNIGGSWGKETQPNAIKQIDDGTYAYHVKVGGNDVKVIVASHNGNKYIKTQNDGIYPDNLLALPECP